MDTQASSQKATQAGFDQEPVVAVWRVENEIAARGDQRRRGDGLPARNRAVAEHSEAAGGVGAEADGRAQSRGEPSGQRHEPDDDQQVHAGHHAGEQEQSGAGRCFWYSSHVSGNVLRSQQCMNGATSSAS